MLRETAGLKAAAALVAAHFCVACVSFPDAPASMARASFEENRIVTSDGASLGVRVTPATNERAIIIAVHGMNDYSNAFTQAAAYWALNGITTYAYDQRGFGDSDLFGRWPGAPTLIRDLNETIAAVHAKSPDVPVVLVGHSMGAGVILAAMAQDVLDVDGVVLAAPGIWGGEQMPLLYRVTLNIAASFTPGKTLTGERTERRSTDNIEILREMFADPRVIKETRMDAILGVVRIMGDAWRASEQAGGKILFVYGEKDEIIPVDAMLDAAHRLCGDMTVLAYPDGWHLLFRDLQAETVWRDVARWVLSTVQQDNPQAPARGAGPADVYCAAPDM